jgi:hypothetical protein
MIAQVRRIHRRLLHGSNGTVAAAAGQYALNIDSEAPAADGVPL